MPDPAYPALMGTVVVVTRSLTYQKFAARIADTGFSLDALVLGYADMAPVAAPASIARVVPNDPDDDQVIACAIAVQAALIVSGDSDLLSFKQYQNITIVIAAYALGS